MRESACIVSQGSDDLAFFKRCADSVMVPDFVPKAGVKIQSDPKEEEKAQGQPAEPPLGEEETVYAPHAP